MYYTIFSVFIVILAICFLAFQKLQARITNQKEKKIFAIFVCGPDPTQDVSCPSCRNLRGQTYIDLLKSDDKKQAKDEEWKEYMIYQNEFPSPQELLSVSCIIITGSKHDAYTDDAEWKLRLQEVIRNIHHNNAHNENKIKLLGICFGHQIIMHSLRGNTNKKVVGRNTRKTTIELGLVKINLNDKFYEFWKDYNITINDKALYILEAHNDVVFRLPSHLKNAEVLASSTYTDIEMYHVGDYILAVQGHPEFTTKYLSNAIQQNMKYMNITQSQVDDILENMKVNQPSTDQWKLMFKKWIRC